jgi:Flp pilus assembly protein CpaB
VVVATMSLEAGTVLDESMIALRRTPSRVVTPSYVKPDALGFIIGQKVVVPVWKGDAVRWSNFEMVAPARPVSLDGGR